MQRPRAAEGEGPAGAPAPGCPRPPACATLRRRSRARSRARPAPQTPSPRPWCQPPASRRIGTLRGGRGGGGCDARPRPLGPASKLGLPFVAPFWTLESPKYPKRSPFRVVSASLPPFNTFSKGLVPVFLPQHPRLPPFPLHPALPVLNGLRAKGTLSASRRLFPVQDNAILQ